MMMMKMFIENKWHVLGLDWAVDFNTQMSYMQRSKNEQWKIMLTGQNGKSCGCGA